MGEKRGTQKKEFSLIVPVAPNRKAEILESIKEIDYPKGKFEVIIKKGTSASGNRNKGVENSKGEYLIFLDDDAFLEKNYLKKVKEFMQKNPEIEIVGGPQLSPRNQTFFQNISGIALTSGFGAFKVNKRYTKKQCVIGADETCLTSANLCVKKETIEKIGGFNEKLFPGEDPEFIQRAKKNGIKIAYNPEMTIYHKRRERFLDFIKQFFLYGYVRPIKNKINDETKLFFFIPALFSLYILLLTSFLLINRLFILPLLAYILLSILFAFVDSIKNKKPSSFFFLPFIYLSIHLSYGIGILGGFVQTWKE